MPPSADAENRGPRRSRWREKERSDATDSCLRANCLSHGCGAAAQPPRCCQLHPLLSAVAFTVDMHGRAFLSLEAEVECGHESHYVWERGVSRRT